MPQFFIPTDFSQVCFSKMGRNIHHTAVVYHPIFNPCVIHTLCRGEIYSNQKFLLFLLIKFCFRKMNPSSAKLKIHARVIVFPSFSKINSKAAFRKAINKKSSFAYFFFLFYVKRASAQDCWPPHAALHFPGQSENQLAERAARASAWGSSVKWNTPFERAPRWRRCWSDEDVCLCRARGWASCQIATAIVPEWMYVIESSTVTQPQSHVLSNDRTSNARPQPRPPRSVSPTCSFFHPHSGRSLSQVEVTQKMSFLQQSRWDKKDTSSPSSLVLELLLADPSPSSHSSFWALAHSSSPTVPLPGRLIHLLHRPHPFSYSHYGHRGGVCGAEAGIIDRASA